MCDKIIDKNGPKPKGTGIKQLRENIAESKLSYEIMDDAAQVRIQYSCPFRINRVQSCLFSGFPQDQNHGQHPEVLLFDLLRRLS